MSNKPTLDLMAIHHYVFENSVRDDELLQALREETAQDEMARMQIAPEQGQFMALLVNLIGARRIIEVGTFTGYSSLCMARALPEDGEMVCCGVGNAPDFFGLGATLTQRRHEGAGSFQKFFA